MNKNKKNIDEILRVNHAGEYGAQVIYKSQIRFSKNNLLKKELKKISSEEKVHLEYFEKQILSNRTRPTIMQPLWKAGGTTLGFISSLLGEKYVHACTEAIEGTIVDHYQKQAKYLKEKNIRGDLRKKIIKFCEEENQHKLKSQKINDNQNGTFLFKLITKNITKLAIKISKKL
tara:strand:+ start:437 stop:958 length:522 start_codon:yes stop_codon:yes gene_type:complete